MDRLRRTQGRSSSEYAVHAAAADLCGTTIPRCRKDDAKVDRFCGRSRVDRRQRTVHTTMRRHSVACRNPDRCLQADAANGLADVGRRNCSRKPRSLAVRFVNHDSRRRVARRGRLRVRLGRRSTLHDEEHKACGKQGRDHGRMRIVSACSRRNSRKTCLIFFRRSVQNSNAPAEISLKMDTRASARPQPCSRSGRSGPQR